MKIIVAWFSSVASANLFPLKWDFNNRKNAKSSGAKSGNRAGAQFF